jgi:uncharacterized protein (TIGR02444 family)
VNTLWDFSLRLYGKAEVSSACLKLQDEHGVDVNLLMFAAWQGRVRMARLSAADVQAAVEATGPWRSRVVMPMRALRRDLKGAIGTIGAIGAVGTVGTVGTEIHSDLEIIRAKVKALELESERMQLAALERLGLRLPTGGAAGRRDSASPALALPIALPIAIAIAIAIRNVRTVLAHWNVPPVPSAAALDVFGGALQD